jgi:hypothetical protein
MTHRRTVIIGALALSTALAVSACAAATAYTAPANDDAYNVECYYDLSDGCAPYVYGPPVVFGYGDLQHFDHFNHFHDNTTHVGHGLGVLGGHGFGGHGFAGHGFVSHGFAGHGFASHGGFGFGGHGGVGRG